MISLVEQLEEYASTNPAESMLPKPLIKNVSSKSRQQLFNIQKPIKHVIGNAQSTRLAQPFDYYRVQRAQEICETNKIDDFVKLIGGEALLCDTKMARHKLARVKNQLHLTTK